MGLNLKLYSTSEQKFRWRGKKVHYWINNFDEKQKMYDLKGILLTPESITVKGKQLFLLLNLKELGLLKSLQVFTLISKLTFPKFVPKELVI